MAYKLKLPEESCVHPVFHISLLKKKKGETIEAIVDLPPINDDGGLIRKLEAILDTRWVKKGAWFVEERLVKWKRLPIDS